MMQDYLYTQTMTLAQLTHSLTLTQDPEVIAHLKQMMLLVMKGSYEYCYPVPDAVVSNDNNVIPFKPKDKK